MFIDKVVIEVRSGKGGDGMIAFLREKCVEKGGPSGGNGGRGGSIIFKANKSINTLFNFRHSKVFVAQDGEKGGTKNKYGHGADDLIVNVPCGTVIYEEKNHKFIGDLSEDGQILVVAKGGRGGRGNAAFKSDRNKCPKIAENGLPGETKRLILELKLLADVGLVGLPNAGKSTLLSVVSNARPEIADYPFTTLEPQLGIVNTLSNQSFVMADLPGLIEGASKGKGLGLSFLRHLERCRVIIHLVSMEEENPLKNYEIIQNELNSYGMGLEKRPMLIVASKMDSDESEKKIIEFQKNFKDPIIKLSSLTNVGVKEIVDKCVELLSKTDRFPLVIDNENPEIKIYNAYDQQTPIFEVKHEKDHVFKLVGDSIERTYNLINLSTDEGVMKLLDYLKRINVEKALKDAGAVDGDTVILCDFEFEYLE